MPFVAMLKDAWNEILLPHFFCINVVYVPLISFFIVLLFCVKTINHFQLVENSVWGLKFVTFFAQPKIPCDVTCVQGRRAKHGGLWKFCVAGGSGKLVALMLGQGIYSPKMSLSEYCDWNSSTNIALTLSPWRVLQSFISSISLWNVSHGG